MATDMIAELREVFFRWRGHRRNGSSKKLDKVPYWGKWRFTEFLLRFEYFCCIFYHPDGFLSQDMWNLRNMFLRPLMAGEEALISIDLAPSYRRTVHGRRPYKWMTWDPYEVTRFNSKAPYEFTHWFTELITSVNMSLRAKQTRTTSCRKKSPLNTEQSEICDFLKRKRSEDRHFCFRLALQGKMLLTHLLSIKTEALEDYIVDAYANHSKVFCILYTGSLWYMMTLLLNSLMAAPIYFTVY